MSKNSSDSSDRLDTASESFVERFCTANPICDKEVIREWFDYIILTGFDIGFDKGRLMRDGD